MLLWVTKEKKLLSCHIIIGKTWKHINKNFKIGINLIKAQYSVDKAAFNLHKIKFRSFCILNCQQLWILRLTL